MALKTWAYKCWPVRCTLRRGTPSERICMRVDLARRSLAMFLSTVFLRKLEAPNQAFLASFKVIFSPA